MHPLAGALLAGVLFVLGLLVWTEKSKVLSVGLQNATEHFDSYDGNSSDASGKPLTTLAKPDNLQNFGEISEAPEVQSDTAISLIDQSEKWHLDVTHAHISGNEIVVPDSLGPAVCALDINNDTFLDLVLLNGVGDTQFYGKQSWWREKSEVTVLINSGSRFAAISIESISRMDNVRSCAVADLDNNGFADLIFATTTGISYLLNDGVGNFIEHSLLQYDRADIITTGIWPGDFDNDGLIDLYVTNYVVFDKALNTFESQFGYKPLQNPDNDASLFDSYRNFLFHNVGSLNFVEVSRQQGVANLGGRSFSAKWIDLDQDGDQDLIVMNDAPSPSEVYLNVVGVGFEKPLTRDYDAIRRAGLRAAGFMVNESSDTTEFYLSTAMGNRSSLFEYSRISNIYRQKVKNASHSFGALSNWAVAVTDFNNDGFSDFYVSNGTRFENQESHHATYGQPNEIYLNSLTGHYKKITHSQAPGKSTSSRSVITADFNHDGAIDVLVGNNNGDFQLFEQDSIQLGNWLNLYFTAERPIINENELILKVTSPGRTRTFRVSDSRSYMSQAAGGIHLGLGSIAGPVAIEIIAGSGWSTSLAQVPVNKNVRVDASSATFSILSESLTADIGDSNLPSLAEMPERGLLAIADNILLGGRFAQELVSLEQLWQLGSEKLQLHLLKELSEQDNDESHIILPLALQSTQYRVRQSAIDIVSKQLPRDAFLWGFMMVQSNDTHVSCAGANLLYRWYEEEELYPLIKRELVVEIIRIHGEMDDARYNCLLRTLAATKSKRVFQRFNVIATERGVNPPLLWAMGRLGDPLAIKYIENVLLSQPSDHLINAAALIALTRLNTELADNYLFRHACHQKNVDKDQLLNCAKWTATLYEARDSLVLDQYYLSTQAEKILMRIASHWDAFSQHDQISMIKLMSRILDANGRLSIPVTFHRWIVDQMDILLDDYPMVVFGVVENFDGFEELRHNFSSRTEEEQYTIFERLFEQSAEKNIPVAPILVSLISDKSLTGREYDLLKRKRPELWKTLLIEQLGTGSEAMTEVLVSAVCSKPTALVKWLHPAVLSNHEIEDIMTLLECAWTYDLTFTSDFETKEMVQVARVYRNIRRDKSIAETRKTRVLLTLSSYFKPIAQRYLPASIPSMPEDSLIDAASILRKHAVPAIGERVISAVRNVTTAAWLTRVESINYLLSIGETVPNDLYGSTVAN